MEPLTEPQLEELKKSLEARRADLEQLLASDDDSLSVELDQSRQGRLSRMDAMQQQAMAVAKRETYQQQLRQVIRALNRMAEDDYGYCLQCDEPIPHARLAIRPEAALCLACQSSRDQVLK